jgi:hypothetical protein
MIMITSTAAISTTSNDLEQAAGQEADRCGAALDFTRQRPRRAVDVEARPE